MLKIQWEFKNSQLGQATPPISLEDHVLHMARGRVQFTEQPTGKIWRSFHTSGRNSSQHATLGARHEGLLEVSRLQGPACITIRYSSKMLPKNIKG